MGGRYSSIRSFAVRSIALGGDSAVRWTGKDIELGPDRLGPAACFGGPAATPTDAVNYLEGGILGSLSSSEEALGKVSRQAGMAVKELAESVVAMVTGRLAAEIKEMFKAWEQEPAYRIWEIINKQKVESGPHRDWGRCQGICACTGWRLNCKALFYAYSPVANALGAAVARPPFPLLHVDTENGTHHLDREGLAGEVSYHFRLEDAKELALQQLQRIAGLRGIGQYADRYEFFREEQFNIIRGWTTCGKLFDIGIQIAPGVIDEFKGVQA